jgi:F-type H+-transporting ATPase subunit delta
MSLKASANRYARALFDVTQGDDNLSQIDRDLSAIAEVMRAHQHSLQPVLRQGAPDAVRRTLVDALAGALQLSTTTRKLLTLLAEGGRLELVPHVAESYRERLLSHRNIVRAQVTSAAPLSPESAKALEASLGRATGKTVELTTAVDHELIGGVVARIGSTVYDGSVKTQLSKIRQTLVQ